MILKLRMSHMRNGEFLAFHNGVLGIVTKNDPVALNVEIPAATYAAKISGMESLYKVDTFNPITAELEELDHDRDEIYNGLLNMLAGNANHFIAEKKEAAHLLQRDLEKYGIGFAKEGYLTETVNLENIVHDWSTKPELQNAVELLGVLSWVNELDRVNQLFKSRFMARTDSYAEKTDETAKGKRAEVVAAYDVLCKYLDSYAFINDTAVYRTTISQINALIEQLSLQLKQRRGRAASAKKTTEGQ